MRGDYVIDVVTLWSAVKSDFQNLVVYQVEVNAVDETIKKKINCNGESDLKFLGRVQIIFQNGFRNLNERQCLYVDFGELTINFQDKVLEWKDVGNLSSEELVSFSKKGKGCGVYGVGRHVIHRSSEVSLYGYCSSRAEAIDILEVRSISKKNWRG